MHELINLLKQDFPELKFSRGPVFSWSPRRQTVVYKTTINSVLGAWSLLHEVAHGVLGHRTYESDLELVILEAAAWQKAKAIAKNYAILIDEDHIQDCVDTYRDWLHKRSRCPVCANHSLQASPSQYKCHNCGAVWQVSSARFCRPYRRLLDLKVAATK